jgi:hypothetical protein
MLWTSFRQRCSWISNQTDLITPSCIKISIVRIFIMGVIEMSLKIPTGNWCSCMVWLGGRNNRFPRLEDDNEPHIMTGSKAHGRNTVTNIYTTSKRKCVVSCPELEPVRVDRHRSPVGSGYRSGRVEVFDRQRPAGRIPVRQWSHSLPIRAHSMSIKNAVKHFAS